MSQNVRKSSTFYTVIEKFRESVRIYMKRDDYNFNWSVFKSTDFILGSFY